jgi:hypothetical protein
MSLSTYAELKAAAADWLNRQDMASVIADSVTLFEGAANSVLRSTRMIGDDAITASTRRVAVPADFIEPVYLQANGDTTRPLEQVSPEQIVQIRRRLATTGTPRSFSVIGRYIELAPAPAVSTLYDLVYYQTIPALSDDNTSNWLLANHPDIYLYGTLLQAAVWMKDQDRIKLYADMMAQNLSTAIRRNELTAMDGVKVPGYFMNLPERGRPLQVERTA